MSRLPARPCLAPGFTVLVGPDRVRLVAGEDFRYTLTGPGLETWLPAWLPALDGSRTADDLLTLLAPERREPARQLLARLSGERVVLDGPAGAAHTPARHALRIEGTGVLAERLKDASLALQACGDAALVVSVLAQDRLDYDEARRFNRRCLEGTSPWLWVTCGPLTRGYVSPVFLPDAGPCLACLLGHFERLSPAPEIYADFEEHARRGGSLAPAPFPERGLRILAELAAWKVELLERPQAPAALFRLHVLEEASQEVTAHRVFADPECGECRSRR